MRYTMPTIPNSTPPRSLLADAGCCELACFCSERRSSLRFGVFQGTHKRHANIY